MSAKQIRPIRRRRRTAGKQSAADRWANSSTMNIAGLDVETPSSPEEDATEASPPATPAPKQIKKQIKKPSRPGSNVRINRRSALKKTVGKRITTKGRGGRLPAFFNKRYQLEKSIGSGGAGTVYKALDKVLGMDVAIKFLPERLSKKKDELERFKLEASIAMKLAHRYIVTLHNLDISRGRYFLIMEYVEGNDFRSILHKYGRLSPQVAIQVLTCCAEALDYAHEHNVIHRDLKPENLMLNQDSVLKIIDFGTARVTSGGEHKASQYMEGTPPYMSPEQILGLALDQRTDIYSLGVVAHEFIEGTPPFPIGMDPSVILETEPAPMTNVPEQIAHVISTATASDAQDRWETAGEFISALELAARRCGIQ